MENINSTTYITTDDNKIINETHIRWIQQIGECYSICLKSNGCSIDANTSTTHKICKLNNPDNFNKLHENFHNIK